LISTDLQILAKSHGDSGLESAQQRSWNGNRQSEMDGGGEVNAYVALSEGGVNAPHCSDVQDASRKSSRSGRLDPACIRQGSMLAVHLFTRGLRTSPGALPSLEFEKHRLIVNSVRSRTAGKERANRVLRAKERFSRRKKPICTVHTSRSSEG
jgi:hypothetical protein